MTARRLVGRTAAIGLAAAFGLLAAGCATPQAPDAAPSSASAESVASAPLLTTGWAVTVIDRDDVPTLCLGGVAQSLPPGCGGPRLIGWDWGTVPAPFEEASGVLWGDYVVTGVYDPDARTFTVSQVEPPRPASAPDPNGPVLPSACPEPAGGWQIIDPDKASYEAFLAANNAASSIDGFATMWVDRSLVPPVPEGTDSREELRLNAVHAGVQILNVAIRGDVAAAENLLRDVWGGPLCVTAVDFTAAEADALLREVMDRVSATHDVVIAAPDSFTARIDITVVYDFDGALQQELDSEYGPGVIRVHSALALH